MGQLDGKVALVSGGASGMGAATARLFTSEGARVLVGDVDTKAGMALAAKLGDQAAFIDLDVAQESSWHEAVGLAEQRFGQLDSLVNCAGVFLNKPLWETTVEECRRLYEVNTLGTFLGIKAVVEPMTRSGGGSIINISSSAGLQAAPSLSFYAATKFAVRGIAKSAAIELVDRKIRVNTIYPGAIDTPMLRRNSAEFNEMLVQMTPLGRLGEASEIAASALFLASDAASFVTGADLAVDGGGTA